MTDTLPRDSIERTKTVGFWIEGDALHVRARLHDRFNDARGPDRDLDLHRYEVELVVSLPTMEVTSIEVTPAALPYEECFGAPPNAQALVGERITPGFGVRAREKLSGELGCTHLHSLLGDLPVVNLLKGYILIRRTMREGGRLQIPANGRLTGICSGWRAGGTLATWMESGRGVAPSHIYPEIEA